MNVIKLSETNFGENRYHGCGIGCLDVLLVESSELDMVSQSRL